jgi:heme/copper-type cytochrome/quinol oxidase subunit 3
MYALPAAPPSAPRRQLFVGTAIACAAGTTLFGGLIAMFVRYRQEALAVAGGEWKPADIKIPEVPTNVNLLAFLFIGSSPSGACTPPSASTRVHVALASGSSRCSAWRHQLAGVRVRPDGPRPRRRHLPDCSSTPSPGAFLALTIIGVVFSVVTAFRFLGGRSGEREIVTAHAMYWYFLGAMYIVLWFVVYVTK